MQPDGQSPTPYQSLFSTNLVFLISEEWRPNRPILVGLGVGYRMSYSRTQPFQQVFIPMVGIWKLRTKAPGLQKDFTSFLQYEPNMETSLPGRSPSTIS